jgi:hypothetical protein
MTFRVGRIARSIDAPLRRPGRESAAREERPPGQWQYATEPRGPALGGDVDFGKDR